MRERTTSSSRLTLTNSTAPPSNTTRPNARQLSTAAEKCHRNRKHYPMADKDNEVHGPGATTRRAVRSYSSSEAFEGENSPTASPHRTKRQRASSDDAFTASETPVTGEGTSNSDDMNSHATAPEPSALTGGTTTDDEAIRTDQRLDQSLKVVSSRSVNFPTDHMGRMKPPIEQQSVKLETQADNLTLNVTTDHDDGTITVEADATVDNQATPGNTNLRIRTESVQHIGVPRSAGFGRPPGATDPNGGGAVRRHRRNAMIGPAWKYGRSSRFDISRC
jgi:flagellar hook protein FlgE